MLKILNVVDVMDGVTREALATEVDRAIDADGANAMLDKIAGERDYPTVSSTSCCALEQASHLRGAEDGSRE